jgi:hypothetical protein
MDATNKLLAVNTLTAERNAPTARASTSEVFKDFIGNLGITGREVISARYERITKALNKAFRNTESPTANSLQVGSYARKTGINGISDLDIIYVLPAGEWNRLKNDQSKALVETREAIETTYSSTSVKVDRLVVAVQFDNYKIEVQPCFEQNDGSFLYPDTYRNEWLVTMPRQEMKAFGEMNDATNSNLRDLCKMARSWRNKHGLKMSGLLVDTLAYQFLNSTNDYDSTSYGSYDTMMLDFLLYLSNEPKDKKHYNAPGSGQKVNIKKRFQKAAKKGATLCQDAIDAEENANRNDKWRKLFGRPFPSAVVVAKSATIFETTRSWDDTEQFIEDLYPVDIRYDIKIDCTVSQHAHRSFSLREFLERKLKLSPTKTLQFFIDRLDPDLLQQSYETRWKVLNCGERARQLNKIRGQIKLGGKTQTERTQFRGEHIVECYIIQHGVVVAKDRIDVPIQEQ